MKTLLIVTAVLEAATGVALALALAPSVPVALLFGAPLATATGVAVGRVAGAALVSLGVACWCARNDGQSRAATG